MDIWFSFRRLWTFWSRKQNIDSAYAWLRLMIWLKIKDCRTCRCDSEPQDGRSRGINQAQCSITKNYLITESEVVTGKSQTEASPYWPSDSEVNTVGRGLIFSRNDRTVEVIKLFIIEWFSIECRKTKTRVITLPNHKGHRQYSKQIKTLSNYR